MFDDTAAFAFGIWLTTNGGRGRNETQIFHPATACLRKNLNATLKRKNSRKSQRQKNIFQSPSAKSNRRGKRSKSDLPPVGLFSSRGTPASTDPASTDPGLFSRISMFGRSLLFYRACRATSSSFQFQYFWFKDFFLLLFLFSLPTFFPLLFQ